MARHRSHSVLFKRQVAGEFIAGETLHALAKRHDISRQLIRIWAASSRLARLTKKAADLIQEYEAKIAALERMVGRQALERAAKGGFEDAPRPRSASTSVVTGPVAFPSLEGASGTVPLDFLRRCTRLEDEGILARIGAICDEFECYGYRRVGAALRTRSSGA